MDLSLLRCSNWSLIEIIANEMTFFWNWVSKVIKTESQRTQRRNHFNASK